ncbi:protein NUCLEAR FUSION DEFECTIVE 4-like [Glycine soja]|uniref:Protein NUCLEAR FUSION DEFECTIVE 4 n=1 Tax=Glycine soja TaxID=3848 RepID=A0A0B2QRF6_GLYSO|nr:protein NUCLEAR FUSION DEFECTIVE 4-like [Glycine soja]KHN23980.1 Putative transporter MCH1 [Glycine soja]RZC17379.1 Protein NUCLEAR FUSION DEFECTIVE 4 [Glycine soja]
MGWVKGFVGHRWVVFVCAMWDMSFAGTSYMFGSISPVIKSSMGFNQKQVAFLSVAKDLGDNVGLLAGKISQASPVWGLILVGVVQNVVGYGLVWLVVTHQFPALPLWLLCIVIFVGQNGSTYYNTAALVSCVQSFPESRGPVVGILKGFVGLSGAIWTQLIAMIQLPDQASLIFIIAVGPAMVSLTFMFIIRPVESYRQSRSSDGTGFTFIYSICLLLAAYLMGVLLLENMFDLDQSTITLFAVILIILIFLPIIVPILLVFFSGPQSADQEALLEPPMLEATKPKHFVGESSTSTTKVTKHFENEKNPSKLEVLPLSEGPRDVFQFQARLWQAVTKAVKKIKRKNGPHRGEDFTLSQAMAKADFWVMFFSLVMGCGSGLTIINNMGQICQSLGDNNVNVYVSVISISNFLGRVGGGYFSEVIVRNFGYPRLAALAVIQAGMSLGLCYYVLGLVGQVYVVAISNGFGYGAHWSIALAAASELFGLKNFGTLYNFLTMASPAGSLFLSGFVASTIYDYYAEQQAKHQMLTGNNNDLLLCEGNICFSITFGILAVVCLCAASLSLIVAHRTRKFYAQLYGESRT